MSLPWQDSADVHRVEYPVVATMPVAYFILCDLLREYTPANRQVALGYVAPLRKLHEPVSVGFFAGRRDFSRVHPLLSWVLKHVLRLVEATFAPGSSSGRGLRRSPLNSPRRISDA